MRLIKKKVTRVRTRNNIKHFVSCKRSAIGEGIINIYRILLISIIALIILGSSAVIFDYYINVRSLEAQVLVNQLVRCLAPDGIVDISQIEKQADARKIDLKYNLLDYCNIQNKKRFYVNAYVKWVIPQGADIEFDKHMEDVRKKLGIRIVNGEIYYPTDEQLKALRAEENLLTSRTWQEGDYGIGWIKDIKNVMWLVDEVNDGREITIADVALFKERWGKYFPGVRNPSSLNYPSVYAVSVLDKGKIFRGQIYAEVIVDHEF
ncbi:hypothetical protein FJZ19_05390 [Candidatus Pacearchaeota archaeon]|nr:hypothetical protein [Candidatus Pacearchaeota archaeon]